MKILNTLLVSLAALLAIAACIMGFGLLARIIFELLRRGWSTLG